MKKRVYLPLFGVGPLYGFLIVLSTVAAALLRNHPVFASGRLLRGRVLLSVVGVFLIAAAVFLWIQAVVVSKIDDHIKENHLVTSGVYAWVRNPIYSALMLLCTGVLLIVGNVRFFVLPFIYWIFMTVLMKNTEEKWLREVYGQEYEDYLKEVHRCIPWPPRKKR